MDLRKQLLADHSKANTDRMVAYIGDRQSLFDELIDLFLNDEYRVVQRAAWVVGDAARLHPQLASPHLERMILNLKNPGLHDAVKRNTVRILQEIELPEALWGEAAEVCFNFLASTKEPVAVKCFSMNVLLFIVKRVPELRNELRIMIEDQLPYGSAGFKSRGKKVIRELNKLT